MVTRSNAGPNFGRSIRIKQGGEEILITSMLDNHVLNYQHYLRALIWHCDTYNEAYRGNIKSKTEAVQTLNWMTNEINHRGMKQYPLKHDYIRQKEAENREKALQRNQTYSFPKKSLLLSKKQARKVIDALPDGSQLKLSL